MSKRAALRRLFGEFGWYTGAPQHEERLTQSEMAVGVQSKGSVGLGIKRTSYPRNFCMIHVNNAGVKKRMYGGILRMPVRDTELATPPAATSPAAPSHR